MHNIELSTAPIFCLYNLSTLKRLKNLALQSNSVEGLQVDVSESLEELLCDP